ncbi:MAG: hypothetical protein K6E29_00505 [Cyanobacteria bacterium RUI128]|nr:hypothetical protein [Cyanobacteria bacterium RUI128]
MKKILPIFISVFLMIMNVLSANASENILRGVDVKRSGNNYTVEITSVAPARMNKNILSANRIIINLKDIGISSNLTTKFDGNSVIDNIIVEPYGRHGANIMIQGDRIAFSDVVFKEPSVLETTQDTIKDSFCSVFGVLSGSSGDKTVQFGILGIFLIVLIAEIRFIKSKYDEFNLEKQQLLSDIEKTKDFQDYLPGYGTTGLKKPYTTPVYGKAKAVNTVTAKTKPAKFTTPETLTLNSLLKNTNSEHTLINRIVNNKPVFGTLSNINIGDNIPANIKISDTISNPISKAKLKANINHLEEMTRLYNNSTKQEIENEFRSRLNRIY